MDGSTAKVSVCVCVCGSSEHACVKDNISPWLLCWSHYQWINYPEGTCLPFPHTHTQDTNTPEGAGNVTTPSPAVPSDAAAPARGASRVFFLLFWCFGQTPSRQLKAPAPPAPPLTHVPLILHEPGVKLSQCISRVIAAFRK